MRYRGVVLGMLAKRFPRLSEDERLELYHDAWARVLAKRKSGEEVKSVRAFLMATAGGEALYRLGRGRPPTPVGPDDRCLTSLADGRESLEDEVVTRDQVRIARGLLDELDGRQRDVLKLRWDLQLSGDEIQAALGLSRRQYRRLTEEGAAAIAERVRELEAGVWSRRQRSLLAACLVEVTDVEGREQVGIATARQRERAQRLLESDPHVAAIFVEVRNALRRASALLPLPAFVPTDGSPVVRLAELASTARGHVATAVEQLKHQATSLYVRAVNPTLLTGPRPGAAVVAVAGCLAIGGGAYATHQATSEPTQAASVSPTAATAASVPPQPRLHQAPTRRPPESRRRTKPKPPPPKSSNPPTPPTPQPQPQSTQQPIPSQPTQPTTEFGFED